jgi:hypothetical protein
MEYPTSSAMRTPYYQMPISISVKSVDHKMLREIHCPECGMPFISISDKIVRVSDSPIAIDRLAPDAPGIIKSICPRARCKQVYQLEFAR